MSRVAPLVVTLAGLGLSGCDKLREQLVVVGATRDGSAVAGLEVRLFQKQQCQGTYAQRALGADGVATFSRTVEIGGLGVITDELSVCVSDQGAWKPLFSSFHGPAPARIDITCDFGDSTLECKTRFDGRPLDEFEDGEDDA